MISKPKSFHLHNYKIHIRNFLFPNGDSKLKQTMLFCNSTAKDASNKGSEENTSLDDLLKRNE